MIVAAVVCPGPPLLVPGLAPRLAQAVPDLSLACRAAVHVLDRTDRVVVLSTGRRGAGTVARVPGTVISAASLARSDLSIAPDTVLPAGPQTPAECSPADRSPEECSRAGRRGGRAADDPAVGTIVAAHLLASADIAIPTTAIEIDPTGGDPAAQVAELLPDLHGPVSTGLLVIADGAASHGPSAPGAEDPHAAEFDAELCGHLAAGDPAALAAFCHDRRDQAAVLRCETLPGFVALAGLSAARPPVAAAIDYYGAPFGVGYIVARWQWRWID